MKNDKKAQTFEAAMERLEEIVSILENGGVPLDETMSLYAEGAKLAAECSSKLKKAEQTIIRIGSKTTIEKDENDA